MSEKMEITKEEFKILMTAVYGSGKDETLRQMAKDNPSLIPKLSPIIAKWESDNKELWEKATEISKRVLTEKEIKDIGLKNWLRG
jgi:hypothetical protein